VNTEVIFQEGNSGYNRFVLLSAPPGRLRADSRARAYKKIVKKFAFFSSTIKAWRKFDPYI
jgi:hypothetical protein